MTSPPTYYAQTMPGVEKIAWLEIQRRWPQAKFGAFLFAENQNGIVVWEGNASVKELLDLRTTEDVFLRIATAPKLSRDWRDLRLLANLLHSAPGLERAAMRTKHQGRRTFRVIARKYGKHQYRRKDLEEAALQGIERRAGRRWQPVEDNADVEIWVNVLGSTLLCGLRLSDRTMRHRAYKVVNHPASLRPSVAAAMVLLTEPAAGEVFLDAMCGDGTILAERMLMESYGEVIGGDIAPPRVEACRTNLGTLGKPFSVRQWDARHLPLDDASVDKAATNLPFGKQLGSRRELVQLYPAFFAELDRVLKAGGRATVLSSEYDLVKQAVRGQPNLQITTGYSIAVLGQWGRLYIIDKGRQTQSRVTP